MRAFTSYPRTQDSTPWFEYAKKKGILLHRSKEIGDIPLLKLSNAKTAPEKIAAIVGNLMPRGASRPRKVKTLSSTINALFQKRYRKRNSRN